jgi:hypothetical protein
MNNALTHVCFSGNNPYYIYGIQLLPLTPISEYRDDVSWGKEMIGPFSKSCDQICIAQGWSIGVLAILATIGQQSTALEQAQQLSLDVFETPGGGGHSKTNTLWYLSTRPAIDVPYALNDDDQSDVDFEQDLTCFQPTTCTDQVKTTMAEGFSCRDRILWLMQNRGLSERGACTEVAVSEYPQECGGCNPNVVFPDKDMYCNQPSTCTDAVLDTIAENFTCRSRIDWLIENMEISHEEACFQIAVQEYPDECGPCTPTGNATKETERVAADDSNIFERS